MELTKVYFSPETTIVEIIPEGVLCSSGGDDEDNFNEPVGSNPGRW